MAESAFPVLLLISFLAALAGPFSGPAAAQTVTFMAAPRESAAAGNPAAAAPADSSSPAVPAVTVRPPAPGPTLWIDFDSNARRLTSPREITAVVDSASRAGFTRIIVDVKRSDGAVAFKSRRAPQIGLPFDYFGAFRKAAAAKGVQIIASIDVFVEGSTRSGKGPAYDHPEWQTVVGTEETGLMPQSDFVQKGPVLFANPCSAAVQEYEASVLEDLLTALKPTALLLEETRFFTREADMSDSTHVMFERWAGLSHADPDHPQSCWPSSVQKTNSPRMPLWATFRIGVIHDFLARVRTLQKTVAPGTQLYLAAPGYYESSVSLGLNWADPGYKPVLWYADDRFRKNGAANLFDQIIVLNRDANPRALWEVMRGGRTLTRNTLPLSVLIDAGQHLGSPGRFRESLQTARDFGMGVVVSDLDAMGPNDFWTIMGEEFPRN